MPRQKALRQAQVPFAYKWRRKMDNTPTSNLELGTVVATPGALAALEESFESFYGYLMRHASRDWGEVPPEDWEENEFSIMN